METVLLVVAILLIFLVLIQSGKADGTSNILMGGNSDLFANRKERGGEVILTRITAIVGIIFFILCLIMTF